MGHRSLDSHVSPPPHVHFVSAILIVDFGKKRLMQSKSPLKTTIQEESSFVNRLSLQDSSLEALAAKVGVAWIGFFAGIGLSDIFTLASIIYVVLNIYVLVRDKIFHKSPSRRSIDARPQDRRDPNTDHGSLGD